MKRILSILILSVLLLSAVFAYAASESLVNPKVFKEHGWAQNGQQVWVYKEKFPFTEYEEPLYGCTARQKVNVRRVPDNPYRKIGQLVIGAPFTILGDCADTWLIDTTFGQGWIPKTYAEQIGAEEYETLKKKRPPTYRQPDPPTGGRKRQEPTPTDPTYL